MVTYQLAPEAEKIGRQLVNKHHTHLEDERIQYVFRSEAATSGGKTVWGKARKVTGLNAFLATPDPDDELADATAGRLGRTLALPVDEWEETDPFFVIELAHDIWQTLTGKQKIALVDHELSHCRIKTSSDGTASITVVGHDIEEFEAVVHRNGLWNTASKHFAKVAIDAAGGDQMSLIDDGE